MNNNEFKRQKVKLCRSGEQSEASYYIFMIDVFLNDKLVCMCV